MRRREVSYIPLQLRNQSHLVGYTLLDAPVSAEGKDVVVEDLVVGGVEPSGGHLLGGGETGGVSDSLSEGSGGAL